MWQCNHYGSATHARRVNNKSCRMSQKVNRQLAAPNRFPSRRTTLYVGTGTNWETRYMRPHVALKQRRWRSTKTLQNASVGKVSQIGLFCTFQQNAMPARMCTACFARRFSASSPAAYRLAPAPSGGAAYRRPTAGKTSLRVNTIANFWGTHLA